MACKRLRPSEAAAWNREHGAPGISVGGLEVMRSRGVGPAYYKVQGRIVYDIADLEAWAAGQRVETRFSASAPPPRTADQRPAA